MGELDPESRDYLHYVDLRRIYDQNFRSIEDEERLALKILEDEDMSHWQALHRIIAEEDPGKENLLISGIILYIAAEQSKRQIKELNLLIDIDGTTKDEDVHGFRKALKTSQVNSKDCTSGAE